jgi:prepilin-type N-terminal cleavage/methylation domain-containing protein
MVEVGVRRTGKAESREIRAQSLRFLWMVSVMKKNRKNAGFTMLELIVVVAIIGILAGVAFVNVAKYQRDLALKEADSAAKELFIAAQNHLTDADA